MRHAGGVTSARKRAGVFDIDAPHFVLRHLARLTDAHRAKRCVASACGRRSLVFEIVQVDYVDVELRCIGEEIDGTSREDHDAIPAIRRDELAHE